MTVREIGDPRLQKLFGADAVAEPGVRPVIRLPRNGPSAWMIGTFAGLAALLLFSVLESRRNFQPAPEVRERGANAPLFSPEPPPLYIPPAPQPVREPLAQTSEPGDALVTQPRTVAPSARPIIYEQPLPRQQLTPPRLEQPRVSSGSPLVIDTTAPAAPANGVISAFAADGTRSPWGGRARSGAVANRSTTVPQGALIPAVLETGFNSTNAGLARAIVSRDVRGFDGTRVLIPRGSRLIGEYQSDVALGQNRALIIWTRLLRPDGVTISLDSPATDMVGRGGIKAHVNSHFWTRLGDALLGSAASIGNALGTRATNGTVVVSVPGSVQQSAGSLQASRPAPTLTVKPATSITVFVARDLEFPDSGTDG